MYSENKSHDMYVENRRHAIREAAQHVFKSFPNDVILDMATREFEMGNPDSCVCGWAFRLGMTKLIDKNKKRFAELYDRFGGNDLMITRKGVIVNDDDPDEKIQETLVELIENESFSNTNDACERLYNHATPDEWERVYVGVTDSDELPIIEEEFTFRVIQAVERQTPKPKKQRKVK